MANGESVDMEPWGGTAEVELGGGVCTARSIADGRVDDPKVKPDPKVTRAADDPDGVEPAAPKDANGDGAVPGAKLKGAEG